MKNSSPRSSIDLQTFEPGFTAFSKPRSDFETSLNLDTMMRCVSIVCLYPPGLHTVLSL